MINCNGATRLFILGAGASVDSGMKTYRNSKNGYYKHGEEIMSAVAFESDAGMQAMWNHVEQLRSDANGAIVGETYKRLETMMRDSENTLVVTQNVDGLIHAINSYDCPIIELHGTLNGSRCRKCGKRFQDVTENKHCAECGSWLRPNIVLFGESVEEKTGHFINRWINKHRPDECYVIGTSLQFNYLHEFIKRCRHFGTRVIHVNSDPDYLWHRKKPGRKRLGNRKVSDELRNEL